MEIREEACLWAYLRVLGSPLCWAPVKEQRVGRVILQTRTCKLLDCHCMLFILGIKTLVLWWGKIAKKYLWAAHSVDSTCQRFRQLKMYHQVPNISSCCFETKDVITWFYLFLSSNWCKSVAASWKQEVYSRFKMKQLSNFSLLCCLNKVRASWQVFPKIFLH